MNLNSSVDDITRSLNWICCVYDWNGWACGENVFYECKSTSSATHATQMHQNSCDSATGRFVVASTSPKWTLHIWIRPQRSPPPRSVMVAASAAAEPTMALRQCRLAPTIHLQCNTARTSWRRKHRSLFAMRTSLNSRSRHILYGSVRWSSSLNWLSVGPNF